MSFTVLCTTPDPGGARGRLSKGVDEVDSHAEMIRVSFAGGRPTPAAPSDLTEPDIAGSRPADVALLRTIADVAAGLTEQLDVLRGRYPARVLPRADPVVAVLDQAAAAANDLHSSATIAADTIATRQPGSFAQ
jgi:hypothetical protein